MVAYSLINVTKREMVCFMHVPASSWGEICGNPVAAAITSCYLLLNSGDTIAFVPDDGSFWPFEGVEPSELIDFREVTNEIVEILISYRVLEDRGRDVVDSRDPGVYLRQLYNVWM
jgi:hypothetical protein